jgi:hypothetical protein
MKLKLSLIPLFAIIIHNTHAQKITLETLIQVDKKNTEEISELLKSSAPLKWQFQSSQGGEDYNESDEEKWNYNWGHRTSIIKHVSGIDSGYVVLETFNPNIIDAIATNIKQYKMKQIEQGIYSGQNYVVIFNQSITSIGVLGKFKLIEKDYFYKLIER